MSNYTLHVDADKKQLNGNNITATSTKIDGGSAAGIGTSVPTGSKVTAKVDHGEKSDLHGSVVVKSKAVFGVFYATAVAITSVANNSGKCRFTLNSHGLTDGTIINIDGSTNGNLDGLHKITAVDTNTFDTDVTFVTSATAGSYNLVAGRFASMTPNQYIIMGYSSSVAGGQKTRVGFGGDFGIRRSIHKVEHLYTRRVATAIRAGYYDPYTGTYSTAPTVADDASTWGADHAAAPTRAVPGELVYRVSGQPDATHGITQDDYKAATN